jgi:cation transport ATPase
LPTHISTVFYGISILTGGYYVFLAAIKGLFKQRFLNINFLVIVASVGAIYINQLAKAATVVFSFPWQKLLRNLE